MGDEEDDAVRCLLRVVPDFAFACPFCEDCRVLVGTSADSGKTETILLHEGPACETFRGADPAQFLHRVRRSMQGKNPRLN